MTIVEVVVFGVTRSGKKMLQRQLRPRKDLLIEDQQNGDDDKKSSNSSEEDDDEPKVVQEVHHHNNKQHRRKSKENNEEDLRNNNNGLDKARGELQLRPQQQQHQRAQHHPQQENSRGHELMRRLCLLNPQFAQSVLEDYIRYDQID